MISIPYGKTSIEFDETGANVLTSRIDELKAEGDGLSIVKAAMENPIDSPRLCELAKGKKLTVTASSGDAFALVCQGKGSIGYYPAATATDTAETTTWRFTALDDEATTQPMGIIVNETEYNNARPGTYTDTVIFTAKVEDNTLQKMTFTVKVYTAGSSEDVDVDFYYVTGETWKQAMENHPVENADWSIYEASYGSMVFKGVAYNNEDRGLVNGKIFNSNDDMVDYDLVVDPAGTYRLSFPK